MKKYIIFGVLCCTLVIGVFLYFSSKREVIRYETLKLDRGDISKYVVATGTVNPVSTVIIGSQVSGIISELYADSNSKVKKGQVVAQIDPVPFKHQVRKAEASLATARAKLEKAKVNAEKDRLKFNRSKKLFEKDVISVDEFDEARAAYKASLAEIKLSEAEVLQAEAALEIAKTDLEHTVIVSPMDGVVISREVDVGQTVVSTFQTPTLFTIAEDLVHMQVVANVNEADIGMVRVGQYAKFTVDAFPEDVFEGEVTKILINPIIFQNVVTYSTIISVDNSSLKLKPGMTANTSILVAKVEGVLRVPNVALRYTPSQVARKEVKGYRDEKSYDKKGPRVWVLTNGVMKPVVIQLGVSDYNHTEVVAGEIKEGQEVVIGETVSRAKEDRFGRVPWSRGGYQR